MRTLRALLFRSSSLLRDSKAENQHDEYRLIDDLIVQNSVFIKMCAQKDQIIEHLMKQGRESENPNSEDTSKAKSNISWESDRNLRQRDQAMLASIVQKKDSLINELVELLLYHLAPPSSPENNDNDDR